MPPRTLRYALRFVASHRDNRKYEFIGDRVTATRCGHQRCRLIGRDMNLSPILLHRSAVAVLCVRFLFGLVNLSARETLVQSAVRDSRANLFGERETFETRDFVASSETPACTVRESNESRLAASRTICAALFNASLPASRARLDKSISSPVNRRESARITD